MKRNLVYLPEVSDDFAEAFNYYKALSPQTAQRFEAAYDRAELQVEEGLITHRVVFSHYHRVILKPYPFILYYRLVDPTAVIVALLYARMSPRHIEAALNFRSP